MEPAMKPGFLYEHGLSIPEIFPASSLMEKYQGLPMSLADACLVAMVEQGRGDRVFTLDRHFRIYRQSRRRLVPVLMPE